MPMSSAILVKTRNRKINTEPSEDGNEGVGDKQEVFTFLIGPHSLRPILPLLCHCSRETL